MSEKQGQGGRPADPFIFAHFTQGEKKEGKSNRWYFKCNYCNKTIEHRDNRLYHHIKDLNKCDKAPSDARRAAILRLATKGGLTIGAEESPILGVTELQMDSEMAQDGPSSKKRKADGKITRFFEKPISREEEAKLNVRLIRYALLGTFTSDC